MDLIRAVAMRIIAGLGADPLVSQAQGLPTAPSATSFILTLILGQELLCTRVPPAEGTMAMTACQF